MKEANDYQKYFLVEIINFQKKTKPKSLEKKQEKEIFLKNLCNFFDDRDKVLNPFESKIFSIKSKGSGLLNTDRSKLNTKTNASKITNGSCTSKSWQ